MISVIELTLNDHAVAFYFDLLCIGDYRNFRELLDVLREKDSTIREMAEEIGMLKQTITQLKQDKSGRVSDASDSTVANAI